MEPGTLPRAPPSVRANPAPGGDSAPSWRLGGSGRRGVARAPGREGKARAGAPPPHARRARPPAPVL